MSRRPCLLVAGIVALALAGAVVRLVRRDRPEHHADAVEHFKYGSIGAEARAGLPLLVWKALPIVFADLLPAGPDPSVTGWARLGFVFEPGHDRPIGTSLRERPFPLVGLNCAACHTGTVRMSASEPRRVILGMGAHQFDPQGFVNFLRAAGADPRFTPDTLMAAIQSIDPKISLVDRLLCRHVLIPATKKGIATLSAEFDWANGRTRQGTGRVDTFNPYKALLGLPLADAEANGAADLPSVFTQRKRQGMALHWDGNNDSLDERNISAAIGAGATADSLDHEGLQRVAAWLLDLPPPAFPAEHIDAERAGRGRAVYAAHCASCHSLEGDGAQVGRVLPLAEVGTDRGRLDSFSAPLAARMNTLGAGKPWKFSHFRKSAGYANLPLDGVWLRAPYLHNGSVPTLRALLFPAERPDHFARGGDVYDPANVGFAADVRPGVFVHDTALPGNGNGGHLFGAELPAETKLELIEFLKTL